MNRTHLEGAAEALAAQQGYAFHTGPEDGMAHTMRSYPAAWLAPLEPVSYTHLTLPTSNHV